MDPSTVGQLAGIVIAVLFGLGLYIWSSLALSGVFRKVGEEQWQAWVPVWNSAVLLRIGGYSPRLVLLALVPVLGQVAFLVVFVMACHRITLGFGYRPGMTVVAALWNPIWASVLAWGGGTWAVPARPFPPVAPVPSIPPAQPIQPIQPIAPAPPLISSAWAPRLEPTTSSAEPTPPPLPPWYPVPPAAPHEDDPVPGPSTAATIGSQSTPSPTTSPLSIGDWRTDTQAAPFVPPPAPPVPQPRQTPPAPPAPAAAPLAAVPPARVEPVAAPTAPAAPPATDRLTDLRWAPPEMFRPGPAPAAAPAPWAEPAPAPAPASAADPASAVAVPAEGTDDHTMLASRLRPSWTLVTAARLELALTGAEVLLGRQPGVDPDHPDAQLLILPDPTRTVSKVHALLRLVDGAWLVRDLGSTNGVTLVAPDGTERTLGPDVEEPLTARFFLGDAEFELREGPPRP